MMKVRTARTATIKGNTLFCLFIHLAIPSINDIELTENSRIRKANTFNEAIMDNNQFGPFENDNGI